MGFQKAIGIFVGLGIALGLVGYFTYPQLIKRDYRTVCEVYTDAAKLAVALEPAELAVKIAESIDARVWTPVVKRVIRAISFASPETKYELMVQSSKELGVIAWECPAMLAYTTAKPPTPEEPNAQPLSDGSPVDE